jgi:chorismate-pyruvate lyase
MSFKEGVDYFVGSTAIEMMMNFTDSSDEDRAAARRYMIKHGATDLLEMVGL